MDLEKIKALVELLSKSKLSELELEEGGWHLRLVRGRTAETQPKTQSAMAADPSFVVAKQNGTPSQADADVGAAGHIVTSPMFGVFWLKSAPDKPPFVNVGDSVHKGQKLCTVEVMKMFHTIEADRDGKINKIFVGNGEEVDIDQPLFIID